MCHQPLWVPLNPQPEAIVTQFNRLDNMMFVRTRVETSKDGEEGIDDGCD